MLSRNHRTLWTLLAALLTASSIPLAACAQDVPRPVLTVDFAADGAAKILTPADAATLVLTTDPAEGVGGRTSLKGDSRGAAPEWNEFFHSKAGLFAPRVLYTVAFDYKVIARAPDAKFYLLARRPGTAEGGAGWQEWAGGPGAAGHIETDFRPDTGGDVLILGIHNKGALAINAIVITSHPDLRPPALPAPARTWKSPGGTSYFVDSARGSDEGSGRSAAHPWRSLDRINGGVFAPGDHLRLKAGSRWAGFLSPGGSGTKGRPITVSAYGTGPKPALDAGGKFLATVFLHNAEYWDVSGLDVANRAPARVPRLVGVQVGEDDFGVAHGIRLRVLDVHDVFGSNVKGDGGGSGISCTSGGGRIPTRFDGLVIENCRLARTDRNGITMGAYYPRPAWPLSTRVVIRGNTLNDIGGDGIVPIGCDGCLIEHNVLHGGRMRASDAAAGIWPWSCDNTVVQFNEVSGMRGTNDGEGYDSDYNCRRTLFQYNLSHDNDGGFMLICDDGGQHLPWNIGNDGTVVRYNVSTDDGLHTFNISGPCTNTLVYNNTFRQTKAGGAGGVPFVASGNWGGAWADGTRFVNNLFVTSGKSHFDLGGMTRAAFDHNAFVGDIAPRPADAHAVLAAGPSLRRAGVPVPGAPVPGAPARDFRGRPAPAGLPPDIGAYQGD